MRACESEDASRAPLELVKYHGLGNDYLVVEGVALIGRAPVERTVRRVCDRHFGVGADGVLVDDGPDREGRWRLRIYNPDGSEAEKSGNGLRIYARYLWDRNRVGTAPFKVLTGGGEVSATVGAGGARVAVDMGRASFDAARIPVAGEHGEVLRRPMEIGGERLEYSAVTVGNPHCVIIGTASADRARRLGPLIEHDPRFVNRTNVQFVRIDDRTHLTIEIWERGAGYTLASGSSSCAAAAVARRLGLIDEDVVVRMPGGILTVHVGEGFDMRLEGPVVRVLEGRMCAEALAGVDPRETRPPGVPA